MLSRKFKSHPGMSAVFSFLFSGLGQIYNGQIKKGLLIIFFSALSMFIIILGSILLFFWMLGGMTSRLYLAAGIISLVAGLVAIGILGAYSIIDAYRQAAQQ